MRWSAIDPTPPDEPSTPPATPETEQAPAGGQPAAAGQPASGRPGVAGQAAALPPPAWAQASSAPAPADGIWRTVVGLVLVVPALVALVTSYIRPTLWTLRSSTREVNPLRGDGGVAVGTDNYDRIAEQFADAALFALSLLPIPLLAIVLVAPLLAYAAHRSGRAGRWAVRLALVVPMVSFAPATLAMAWLLDLRAGVLDGSASPLVDGSSVRDAVALTTFGLICGLAVTAYLAALRRREAGHATWLAALAVGGIAVATMVAVSLQTFAYPFVMTRGGPGRSTVTPQLLIYEHAFQRLEFGAAAAAAMRLGTPVALLGIAVAVVVLLSRMRMEVDPAGPDAGEPAHRGGGAPVGAIIAVAFGLLLVLAVTISGLWPWLSRLTNVALPDDLPPLADTFVATWLPPLVSTIIGVGVAAVAGLGIGMLRPLGRFSELLLLPFAPWLLVGMGPLSVARFWTASEAGLLNTIVGLIPPVFVTIPALFVFSMLFRGQERRWRALRVSGASPGSGFGRALVPALPMVALVSAATWLVQAQSLLWPLLIANDRTLWTGPIVVMHVLGAYAATPDLQAPIGAALPLVNLVAFAVLLGVVQVLYLDRVAIRVGRP